MPPMSDDPALWDLYWEVRLKDLEDLGKREAILETSRLLRAQPERPARLLELGCGAGQIIGALLEAHPQALAIQSSCGVDYSSRAIAACRKSYPTHTFPQLRFIEGDFTDPSLLASLGTFDYLLFVNALHEVFSFTTTPDGPVDVARALVRVRQALTLAAGCLAPGGRLLIFDGLEPPGDPLTPLRIRFRHWPARRRFETFARQYRPFRISYQTSGDPDCITLSQHDFARYITKSIFLEKPLWASEQFESYQYFTEADFRAAISALGFEITSLRTLSVNYEKWNAEVVIETPGIDFPAEHILIVAAKPESTEPL